MATLSEQERRIHELETALKHERERSATLQKRADALEASARLAYRLAAFGPTRRDRQDA